MHRGKGVAPQGKARCMECRNSGNGYYLTDDGRRLSHGESAYCGGCRCRICVNGRREKNMAYKDQVRSEHGVGPSTIYKRKYHERTGVRYGMGHKDWIDPKVRRSLYERDNWKCHLCGEPVDRDAHFNDDFAPSLDHVTPRSEGGSDNPKNLKTAHRICNSIRQDDPLLIEEVSDGWEKTASTSEGSGVRREGPAEVLLGVS